MGIYWAYNRHVYIDDDGNDATNEGWECDSTHLVAQVYQLRTGEWFATILAAEDDHDEDCFPLSEDDALAMIARHGHTLPECSCTKCAGTYW